MDPLPNSFMRQSGKKLTAKFKWHYTQVKNEHRKLTSKKGPRKKLTTKNYFGWEWVGGAVLCSSLQECILGFLSCLFIQRNIFPLYIQRLYPPSLYYIKWTSGKISHLNHYMKETFWCCAV